jgi:soluble lytic murein transglycosylase-like protein
MSAQTLTPAAGTAGGGPADALAATQRVQQLQALIAQAQQGGSTASFAAALDAASGRAQSALAAGPGAAVATAAGSATAPSATATAALTSAAYPTSSAAYTTTSAVPGVSGAPTGYTPTATATATPPAGGSASTPYDGAIAQAAARYNLDPAVLHGLIQQESGFNPNSRSSAGALGLTQLMPGTASSLGVGNPLDPLQSIEGGARYLSQMMSQFGGNTEEALAAYNAGPGAVHRYGGVPPYPETQDYVNKVLGYANAYRQSLASTSTPSPTGPIA